MLFGVLVVVFTSILLVNSFLKSVSSLLLILVGLGLFVWLIMLFLNVLDAIFFSNTSLRCSIPYLSDCNFLYLDIRALLPGDIFPSGFPFTLSYSDFNILRVALVCCNLLFIFDITSLERFLVLNLSVEVFIIIDCLDNLILLLVKLLIWRFNLLSSILFLLPISFLWSSSNCFCNSCILDLFISILNSGDDILAINCFFALSIFSIKSSPFNSLFLTNDFALNICSGVKPCAFNSVSIPLRINFALAFISLFILFLFIFITLSKLVISFSIRFLSLSLVVFASCILRSVIAVCFCWSSVLISAILSFETCNDALSLSFFNSLIWLSISCFLVEPSCPFNSSCSLLTSISLFLIMYCGDAIYLSTLVLMLFFIFSILE